MRLLPQLNRGLISNMSNKQEGIDIKYEWQIGED